MNRIDHFLWILSEECNEVGQRASKAARFSLEEVQGSQTYNNAERIMHEWADLVGVMEKLIEEGAVKYPDDFAERVATKKSRIEQFLKLSKANGRLEG